MAGGGGDGGIIVGRLFYSARSKSFNQLMVA